MSNDYNEVKCVLCDYVSHSMLGYHLISVHHINSAEYRKLYNAPTVSRSYSDKRSSVAKKNFSNPETKDKLRRSIQKLYDENEDYAKRRAKSIKDYWSNNPEIRRLQSKRMSEYHKNGTIDDVDRNKKFWTRFANDTEFRVHYLRSQQLSGEELEEVQRYLSTYSGSNKDQIVESIDSYLNSKLSNTKRLKCPECGESFKRLDMHMTQSHNYATNSDILKKYPNLKLYELGVNSMNRSRHSYVMNDGTLLVLRSFLECRICKFLEINDIKFDYETLSISYTLDGKVHNYIPDFYLSDYNLILEGKPDARIDKVSEAKRRSAEELGYNFIYVGNDIISDYDNYLTEINKMKI